MVHRHLSPNANESPPCSSADVAGIEVEDETPLAPALLPAAFFDEGEIIILMIRPSPLFVLLASFGSIVAIGFAAVLGAYLARWQPWVPWTDVGAFALGLALAAGRLGWQALDWYGRLYVLTNRRVIRRHGVLRVGIFESELRRIQHTSVFARVRERLFGLGSIGFATAGSHTFEAYWMMLRDPYAVHKKVIEAMRRAR